MITIKEKERMILFIELQIKSIDETISVLNKQRNDIMRRLDKLMD